MKKGVLGCFGIFVVLTLIIGAGFYFLLYKPFISDYIGGFAQLTEVTELNDQVENRAAYVPPEDDVLRAAQVERFVSVQAEMEAALGQRIEALKAKYKKLEMEMEAEGREVNYLEMFAGFRDMMGLITEAKRIQVEALNRHDFSLDEYAWVRREAYRAAGLPVLDVGLMEVVEATQNGNTESLAQQTLSGDSLAAPEPNRRLVKAHQEQLERMAGLSFFGL